MPTLNDALAMILRAQAAITEAARLTGDAWQIVEGLVALYEVGDVPTVYGLESPDWASARTENGEADTFVFALAGAWTTVGLGHATPIWARGYMEQNGVLRDGTVRWEKLPNFMWDVQCPSSDQVPIDRMIDALGSEKIVLARVRTADKTWRWVQVLGLEGDDRNARIADPAEGSIREMCPAYGRDVREAVWVCVALDVPNRQQTPSPPASGAVPLDVPWKSQLSATAARANGDCGPAAVAMVLGWRGRRDVTVDDVSAATGLGPGFKFTVPADLISAAGKFDLRLEWRANWNGGAMLDEIAGRRPVIALVHYPSLPDGNRRDKNYPYSHWVVVVGVDGDDIIYHDPYHTDGAGAFLRCPRSVFDAAWANTTINENQPRQALVVVG